MADVRIAKHRYADPLDVIWASLALALGMRIRRASEAYASWDGNGTLTIAPPADLDPDDCLAQMVLHEICHALVAGPRRRRMPDWGLHVAPDDLVEEHATNRLQAALAGRYGLRHVLATTTEFRAYYDALPADPLAGEGAAVDLARAAEEDARTGPWSARLAAALRATSRLAREVHATAPSGSLWALFEPLHPSGLPAAFTGGASGDSHHPGTCSGCAWYVPEPPAGGRCRQARHACVDGSERVLAGEPGCRHWEPVLMAAECGTCAACCLGGFDRVEFEPSDPVCERHPELVTSDGDVRFIARAGKRCLALSGGEADPFRCTIYPERPRPCAEFEVGGDACLEARRRLGMSGGIPRSG